MPNHTPRRAAYLYDYKTKTKTPVANVSLTVAYAKGPAVSHKDGTFTIEFQDFGAGKKLAFEKQPYSQGLIVLNKKEVDEWSTFEGRLTLIMCNKKDFDACKRVLAGTIIDEQGKPVSDAMVEAEGLTCTSQKDGTFKLHIPIEKQKPCPHVRISKAGYQTEEYTRQGVGLNWQIMLLKE